MPDMAAENLVRPQFVFNGNELRLVQPASKNPGVALQQQHGLELLSGCEGVIIEPFKDSSLITVDTSKYAISRNYTHDKSDQRISKLLRGFAQAACVIETDSDDQGLSIADCGPVNLTIGVHSSFQLWLNRNSLLGPTPKNRAVQAMSGLFATILHSNTPLESNIRACSLITAVHTKQENYSRGNSLVAFQDGRWTTPWLQTLGNHTTLEAETPIHIDLPLQTPTLYELRGKNITSPAQTLSLLLGAAALTKLAAPELRSTAMDQLAPWPVSSTK